MSTVFLTDLEEKLIDPFANDGTGLWQLTAVFRFKILGKITEVPVGFTHDHASVPIAPVVYAMFGNRYHRPAVGHDFLCRQGYWPRHKCDLAFLRLMQAQNDEEIQMMRDRGLDDDEILDRKASLEGRAQAMYAAVVLYSRSGVWKTDVHKPGFEPIG